MKAAPADQLPLLDIARIDAALARVEHELREPPQAARVKELLALRGEQGRELVARQNALDDRRAELARVVSDIDVAAKRKARDEQRLGQTAIARDAQALEGEIQALATRIDALETTELELMEQVQQAEAAVAEQQALLDATTREGQELSAAGKQAVQKAADEKAQLERDRASYAERVPEPLLADYTRIAARTTGAALFQHGTCRGCRMTLAPTDLAAIQRAADDEVLHCPECGCIVVRTAESGL